MSQEALDVLRSIDATLKQMLALAQQRAAATRAAQPKTVATDRELDGNYGDPVVKFIPRNWSGSQSFKGKRMSECPPALLDMLAETFDYFAGQAEAKNEMTDRGKPVAEYKRADAARARGWAKRMRSGTHPAPQAEAAAPSGTGDGWAQEDGWS